MKRLDINITIGANHRDIGSKIEDALKSLAEHLKSVDRQTMKVEGPIKTKRGRSIGYYSFRCDSAF
jgi:hypothetical protein